MLTMAPFFGVPSPAAHASGTVLVEHNPCVQGVCLTVRKMAMGLLSEFSAIFGKVDYHVREADDDLFNLSQVGQWLVFLYPWSILYIFVSSMSLRASVWFKGGSPMEKSLNICTAMPPMPKRITDPK